MKTAVVNGTFDIIHVGHLALLTYARSISDRLIVAIDSDQRVKDLKGPKRPINNQFERATLLINLKSVDEVRIFSTDEELINIIKLSDLMVKGSDYRGKPIVGQEYCPEIVFFERLNDYSSTSKIQSIIDR